MRNSRHISSARILAAILAASLILAGCQNSPGAEATSVPAAQVSATALPAAATPSPAEPTVTPFPAVHPIATNTVTSTATLTATAAPSPAVEMTSATAGKVILPILMYHHVSDKGGGRYFIPVKTFREQMEYLKQEGYHAITISQLADAIRGGGELPVKPVAITFDDGYLDTYENAFPILQELGYTATAYIITGTVGTRLSYGYMQVDELKALAAAGWEIGSHSVTHNDLRKTKLGAGNEMTQSKKTLEDLLGVKVRSFSFPLGAADPSLKDLAAHSGYDSAVGIDVFNTHTTEQLYFLSRREVYRSLTMFGFKDLLGPSKVDNIMATQSAWATPTP